MSFVILLFCYHSDADISFEDVLALIFSSLWLGLAHIDCNQHYPIKAQHTKQNGDR